MTQLTKNFDSNEFTYSPTATAHHINNSCGVSHLDNLKALCENVLQPLRDKFGPIIITSGYRCLELNKLIGGSPTSNHLTGCAADILPKNSTFKHLYDFITTKLDYDECFIEQNKRGEKWLHVAYRKQYNRRKHNPNFVA